MRAQSALSYLEPLETRTRGVAVLDALADMVERSGLKIGDRLPPEVSLAATLGVGRSTIREALNRWEGLGIIRRRRGDGTYLTAIMRKSPNWEEFALNIPVNPDFSQRAPSAPPLGGNRLEKPRRAMRGIGQAGCRRLFPPRGGPKGRVSEAAHGVGEA